MAGFGRLESSYLLLGPVPTRSDMRCLLLILLLLPAHPFNLAFAPRQRKQTKLNLDQQVLYGGLIAAAGLGAGIGIVAFTEKAGESTVERGGLSDGMATSIAGGLMEDVEVSTVSDVGGLAERLETALKKAGVEDDVELTEEEMQKKQEELDDGW